MYLVLARKYRPSNFDEVCGQKHVTDVLKKALKDKKVAHAYIFSGPRGTGKTSIARILAKALNCEKGPTAKPCGTCDICNSISAGSCLDVLEIDGASNRGIDEIRSLRENANLTPSKAPFKIYIIDEVHMLTNEACNALLKTLEEPPAHVKFMFATTAPEKILPTILSRCQRFNFLPFRQAEIEERLQDICKKEGLEIESEALKQIYGFSGGSLRDALGILDQLAVNAEKGKITYDAVKDFLGLIEEDSLYEILAGLKKGDITATISCFHRLLEEGKDPALILDGLIKKIKNIILLKIGQSEPAEQDTELAKIFSDTDVETLLNAVSTIIQYKERLRRENIPVVLSEILFLKISRLIKTAAVHDADEKPAKQIKAEPSPPGVKEKPDSIFDNIPEKEKSPVRQAKQKEPPKAPASDTGEIWKELLRAIKRDKPTVEAALREGSPGEIKDDKMSINFDKKYAFHKSVVEKVSNAKIIEKHLASITGNKNIKPVFVLQNKEESSFAENKQVKNIVGFFNGEIIELEE